jgi:hypothetical protein
MHIVSFDKKALNITMYNQYQNLELIFPVYCSTGTICYVSPSQQIDTGNTMKASFRIDSEKNFEGALLCKLQRKHITKTDKQLNSSAAFIENTATNMYLLAIWDVGNEHRNCHVWLIECINDFIWDEDKLWALYRKYRCRFDEFCDSNTSTWLMHDGEVMKTRFDITYESDCKLDITISEGIRIDNMEEPMKIDLKRLVLLLLMLSMLIYAVRLTIQPSFKLNIHNQYLNIDLVSPVYITDALECHRAPSHKVCAGDIMRSSFIIYDSHHESSGALICKLQRKQPYDSNKVSKDTSSTIYLLATWRISGPKKLYADVLLVAHDKGFDKDNLEKLYRKNINRFRLFSDSVTEIWSLDDKVVLKTTSEIINENFILNVTISEVDTYNDTRTPVHIDPER